MLQSLTVPGWGQLTNNHPGQAKVFGLVELGIWTAFAAFEVQQDMRTEASIRTARQFAGIDLSGRTEQYRRIVGDYPSSDEYNTLVVFRDAANQFYNDPVAYREYIAKNEISGANGWSWVSPESYDRYRAQRKDANRAGLRANTALALAIANRLVSAAFAAGSHRAPAAASPARGGAGASGSAGPGPLGGHALRLEFTPDFSRGQGAVRLGLGTSF
jgi:hypothetical protein